MSSQIGTLALPVSVAAMEPALTKAPREVAAVHATLGEEEDEFFPPQDESSEWKQNSNSASDSSSEERPRRNRRASLKSKAGKKKTTRKQPAKKHGKRVRATTKRELPSDFESEEFTIRYRLDPKTGAVRSSIYVPPSPQQHYYEH